METVGNDNMSFAEGMSMLASCAKKEDTPVMFTMDEYHLMVMTVEKYNEIVGERHQIDIKDVEKEIEKKKNDAIKDEIDSLGKKLGI